MSRDRFWIGQNKIPKKQTNQTPPKQYQTLRNKGCSQEASQSCRHSWQRRVLFPFMGEHFGLLPLAHSSETAPQRDIRTHPLYFKTVCLPPTLAFSLLCGWGSSIFSHSFVAAYRPEDQFESFQITPTCNPPTAHCASDLACL